MSAHTLTSLDAYRDPDPPAPVRESHDWFSNPGPFVPLGGALLDSPPFGWRGTSGSVSDRAHGRKLPVFWSELDLRWYRVLARHLADTNNFAIGFLGHLVGYNVRKGFGWQACRKGVKKTAYQTVGTTSDPLVAKAQQILDSWRDANQWPITAREAFLRWRRDGEAFGRLFAGGWDALPAFRFVEPEQVGAPDGDTSRETSFGVRTAPGDVKDVVSYYVRDLDGDGLEGEWVGAEKIVHIKSNVDSCVKRGVTDFLPMSTELEGVRQLLRAMLDTSNEQAKIAWMEKFPNAVVEQVRALLPQRASSEPQYNTGLSGWPYTGQQSLYSLNGFRPSRVVRVEGTREFEPGPTSAGVGNFLLVEQACLRGCCARWGMPENFTSDASNNNLASIIAAGSPFVVAIEGSQLAWGSCWERPIALKVLDAAVDAGMLTQEERRQLDVETTEPAVVTPEPDKDAARIVSLNAARLLSPQTAQQQLGLDPQHEAANFKAAEPAPQPQQPGNDPKGGGAAELLGLGEGKKKAVSEAAPGPPPRPGLVWNDDTHRWRHPETGEEVPHPLTDPDDPTDRYHHEKISRHGGRAVPLPEFGTAEEFGRALATAVAARLPAAAVGHLAKTLKYVHAFYDPETVTAAFFGGDKAKAAAEVEKDGEVFGYYNPRERSVALDGGIKDDPELSTAAVYAHELGHALDRSATDSSYELSDTDEFREAFGREIAAGQLSEYGATNRQEGFAEFARLLYGSDVPRAEAEKQFPLTFAFFRAEGLA
jgi:hypothetical protein